MMLPALIVVALALGVLALPALRKASGISTEAARCRAIQEQLALMGQGGDPAVRAGLVTALRQCGENLRAMGDTSIDLSGLDLSSARAAAATMDAEWSHYKSTDYADGVKRGNTRGTVMRIAETELVPSLRRAIAGATSLAQLAAARELMITEIAKSADRAACIMAGSTGCSRYGLNEPDWDERARDELLRIAAPLGIIEALDDGWRSNPAWPLDSSNPGALAGANLPEWERTYGHPMAMLATIPGLRRIIDTNVGQFWTVANGLRERTEPSAYADYTVRRAQLGGVSPYAPQLDVSVARIRPRASVRFSLPG